MRSSLGWLGASFALVLFAGCETEKPEDHPAFRKAVAVEERVVKVENQAEALVPIAQDVDQLKTQLRSQNGQIEELGHQLSSEAKARQLISADTDARLKALEDRIKALETKAADAPPMGDGKGKSPAASDKDAYQTALGFFKQKAYAECADAFESFTQTYPDSPLMDNALFWNGACRYSDNHLGEAMSALSRLLKEHPDSRKIPDALLVMARAESDLKRPKEAKELLKRLIKDYPDAAVIPEAKTRLKALDAGR